MDTQTLERALAALQDERKRLDRHIANIENELRQAQQIAGFSSATTVAAKAPTIQLTLAKNVGGRPAKHPKCTVPGCNAPHIAKGLCNKHYSAARKAKQREAREGVSAPKDLS